MKNRGLKIIALLLCIAMAAAMFAACGDGSNKGGDEINYDIDLTQKPKLNILMPNSGKPIEAVNSNSNALLIQQLTGSDPETLWESNIFGKSVYDLIQEGLTSKVVRLPEDVREKFRGSISRIVNEGATGLICLIL